MTGGNLILNNASVMGNVNIEGGGTYTLGPALSIMSTLDIENIPSGTAQNSICGVTVNGGLQVDANATAVQIGSSSGSCAGNTIGGDLEILSNSALVQTFNNKVGNNLVCTGNNSVSGGGNTARQKQTQCSSF